MGSGTFQKLVVGGVRLNAKSDSPCAVCGHLVDPISGYLLMAQVTPPRIAILHWNKTLARREEARAACSPEHALEIVAHWMVSGRLDLKFTEPALHEDKPIREMMESAAHQIPHGQPIGELVINRDSVRRLVASDPEALVSVLDSLLEVLLRDRSFPPTKKPALGTTANLRVGVA
jgi:hypothetical protein